MINTTHNDDNAISAFENYAKFAAEEFAHLEYRDMFERDEWVPKPGTPGATALGYTMRDWNVVPLPFRQKKPVSNDWQHRIITGSKVERFFGDKPQNIGVQLGLKSGGLTDIDLDCQEAIAMASALLPATDAIFGRASKRDSHYLYNTSLASNLDQAALQFKDPISKGMLLEVRIGGGDKGAQTVFPGSVHEGGEPIKWEKDGEPACVGDDALVHRVKLLAALCLFARYWPTKPKPGESGGRHDAALTIGGFFARCGFDVPHVKLYAESVARAAHDEEWRDRVQAAHDAAIAHQKGERARGYPALKELFGEKIADKAAEWLGYDGDRNQRPDLSDNDQAAEERERGDQQVIFLTAHAKPAIAQRAEEILLNSNVPLYQRAGTLVRPIIEEADASHGRRTKIARLIEIKPIYLRNELDKVAVWIKYDARSKKNVRTGAPADIAHVILSQLGHWTFPSIAGVITTPTMRPDGSLLLSPGYDEATRLLLMAAPPMPPIPEHPTRDDAVAALNLLLELLSEFPFVDDVARSVALSGLITPVVRGAFPVAPMHVARAPVAGSGKSFLWDTAAAISIGKPMPVMSAAQTEEELEKRLVAAALAGQPLLSIDNISGDLRSDLLCQLIERQIVDVRILGKSERVSVETRGLTTYGTGNNVAIYADLTRRTLVTSLDPEMERPETRRFSKNPVDLVLADRGKYVAACLTICRAYKVAGSPNKVAPLASFEGWSDTVRSALMWLGQADPVESFETARAEDPDRVLLLTIMLAWKDAVGLSVHRTLAQVVTLADHSQSGSFEHPELRDALVTASGKKSGQDADVAGLGVWLRRRKGRVVEGMRFVNEKSKGHAAQWWLEEVRRK
ncbi:bifunctional DNA primase/polymerase [Bradyrhizobium sp. 166]|uniref:bifunctional DNA primase/polymerase n=1 Tax=Bradyrhizobium sp. 166 TaxID=2782638 RepID=UPI001FF89567|nr:bifunctional DNA primase/polymerase [Bradyrhizobium sp. 166]MCK1607244.1 bifunctional DNA primase/polymerase [Bradyrhizobium sp. 166]